MRKPRADKTKPTQRARKDSVQYKAMKGRTVEVIEVSLSPDYPCVSIRFQDNTDFTVEIGTRLVLKAIHSDWKTGSMRVLKRWPAIRE